MLSFILAGLVAFGTVVLAGAMAFADGMSDAPGSSGTRLWPVFVIGFGIAALLVASYYFHVSW